MIKSLKYILVVLFLANFAVSQAFNYQMFTPTRAMFHSTSPNIGSCNSGHVSADRNSSLSSRCVLVSESAPSACFKSTSTISGSGSTLPCAAETGVCTTIGDETSRYGSGPRRVGGWDDNNAGDPGAVPLGDAVLPLLLLAAGYAIYLRRKNSVRTSDSGHQQ